MSTSGFTVGVLSEDANGERRVALDPDAAKRVIGAGPAVLVESGAGGRAWFSDEQYQQAGAGVLDRAAVIGGADVIVSVSRPDDAVLDSLRAGQVIIGLLAPLTNPDLVRRLADRSLTAISLDQLPRTLSRAQGMDALSSQANVAGYRAVLVAAEHFDRFFPLLITAAGTSKPATVLVLGAGVAGLQAIGTARRLGAVVSGYDVRPAAREEVSSLGAKFVELSTAISGAGAGGYARELSEEERSAQQAELSAVIARHDIVITTAQVPGRTPPVLVTAQALAAMRAGSVVVDMAASALGGNVVGSEAGRTIVTANGVTLIGATNLPARLATSASQTYARNVAALLKHLTAEDGSMRLDPDDEITAGVLITRDGRVVHPGVAAAMGGPA
ncbi:Re/Si-specific NAD(P)(+) transhydrogenase subunit alpha [Jatrophihabitans telluris]|uniref:proton-translocating NAD(P)(+) transhydrogenase n=1 Tax=Jatrophihabitans telluris TaxID=2038343 RepID=A0ABY4R501_9ACTN|nr:Re/Si-specific NAD(P)(+) transhydrogenase subunit alpha [Jatrophihabitans telluris]UQX90061.1 Re/Si-specific NAD(P)(+) transhydrogenase subunit alpha [Jatrophihabitans telluris]